MVTDVQHALDIQNRRVDSGKWGIARAVRRFIKKNKQDLKGLKVPFLHAPTVKDPETGENIIVQKGPRRGLAKRKEPVRKIWTVGGKED